MMSMSYLNLRIAVAPQRTELLGASGPAASTPARPGLCLIDADRATFNLPAIEFLDRRISGLISPHLDKAKTAGAVRRAIHDYLRAIHRSSFGKYVLQILIRDSPG